MFSDDYVINRIFVTFKAVIDEALLNICFSGPHNSERCFQIVTVVEYDESRWNSERIYL